MFYYEGYKDIFKNHVKRPVKIIGWVMGFTYTNGRLANQFPIFCM